MRSSVCTAMSKLWFKCKHGFFLKAICVLLSGLSFIPGAHAADIAGNVSRPKDFSKPYIERQTFKGQAFLKDNNVWVYTPAFAKTFGMPQENIDPDLTGIEAAAFRIEDSGFKLCGMGGRAENCMDMYRCVTDIYIDEAKYSLPWATDNQSDWFAYYNSLMWLQAPHELGYAPNPPEGVIPNEAFRPFGPATLRPFADSATKQEVIYLQDGGGDHNYNFVPIYGYKRKAIAGLTLITLNYNCLERGPESGIVTFRLENRKEIKSPTRKRFHEFQLSGSFLKKINERIQVRRAYDSAHYQKLFNQLNQK